MLIFFIILLSQILCFNQTVFAGQIHYPRIPYQYWEHRIKMLKAMGLNALSVYVFWNFHQEEPDQFDFTTGSKNLSDFLRIAQQQQMGVLLRPGPYVCAEWDLGGLPYWLLAQTQQLRTTNPYFMERSKMYLTELDKIIKPYYQKVIKLIQIENQYGSFGSDQQYIRQLVAIWNSFNTGVQFYHADGPSLIKYSHWPGANIGLNSGLSQSDYTNAHNLQPNAYVFSSQTYTGWITHQGDAHFASTSVTDVVNRFKWLCSNNHSFGMYMAHGGTNFEFHSGCNSGGKIQPVVASYDYDSPVNEQGNATQKFFALKDLFKQYATWTIPQPPTPINIDQIPVITPKIYSSFDMIKSDWINLPITKKFLQKQTNQVNEPFKLAYSGNWSFENNKLGRGYAVYRFTLPKGNITLQINFNDIAYLYIDDVFYKMYDRTLKQTITYQCKLDTCQFSFTIQSVGHINYGGGINNKKGLLSITTTSQITKLQMKKFPLNYSDIQSLTSSNKTAQGGLFYDSTFNLQESQVHDTYLDMTNYGHGYIWINGHNLGKYWNIGPQHHYYCPGVWLVAGSNRIIVLQNFMDSKGGQIRSGKTLLKQQQINYQQI